MLSNLKPVLRRFVRRYIRNSFRFHRPTYEIKGLKDPTPYDARLPKILCYSPYTPWTIHSSVETLIIKALALRGHPTKFIMCDSVFSQCDVIQTGIPAFEDRLGKNGEKTRLLCNECKRASRVILTESGIDFEPLSQWISNLDRLRAMKWSKTLRPEGFAQAEYEEWRIGEWVVSSVLSHFRANRLNLADPAHREIYRRYLYSGLLACWAIDRMLEAEDPEVLLVFNGRMSSTRIALELGRRRGIRCIVEERGLKAGRIRLFVNQSCLYLEDLENYWDLWRSVPLSSSELVEVSDHLHDRQKGQSSKDLVFSPPDQDINFEREKLGLDDREVWVLFTSSTDEISTEERAKGLFPNQSEWVLAITDHVARHNDVQLIIRVHPNVGSLRSIGRNIEDMQFYSDLKASAPENVHVILSTEDVSSYSLMDLASTGFIWHSLTGLEMACKGKRVFVSGGWFLSGKEFLTQLRNDGELESHLLAARGHWSTDDCAKAARLAFRCAYILFFRASFPLGLVKQPNWYTGEYDFERMEVLKTGADPELDHILSVVLGDRPIVARPCSAELNRTEAAEDHFLAQL